MRKYVELIEGYWQKRALLSQDSEMRKAAKKIVTIILDELDSGNARVAQKIDGVWSVNQWAKKAILLYFQLNKSQIMSSGITQSYDKIPLKCDVNWEDEQFENANFRLVPGAIVRKGAYIGQNVVLMPSFVNVGAYIGEGSMIDAWSTIGSCAQIGSNCHISGGVGIGGVLEPIQSNPVIIEDNCFIGARSEIAEGVVVQEGAVISMGVFIGASTKIYDRDTGEIHIGTIPPYSVVVPGSLPNKDPLKPSLSCAVIVKKVDAQTRSKTSVNEILRS